MKKDKIVLLHGILGPGKCQWIYWERFFKDHDYEVVVLKLPGHSDGESVLWKSLGDYINYVVKETKDIGDFILVGHSMGGLIAQAVANKAKNVKRVVLVNSAPPNIFALSPLAMLYVLSNPIYWIKFILGLPFRLTRKHARNLVMNHLPADADPSVVLPNEESGWAALQVSLGLLKVEPMKQPCLVIAGDDDNICPMKFQDYIKNLHGAEIFKYKGGHMPMIEEVWRSVAGAMLYWLEPEFSSATLVA